MKTTGPNKVIIKVVPREQQQESARNPRSTLKVLQEVANKENLVGRSHIKDTKLAGDNGTQDIKHKKFVNKAVQTGEATVTTNDLTTDEPSTDYWRLLAEKRGETLNDSLQENERLKEQIESLEEEKRIYKEMLEESKHLVAVLQEMLGTDEEDTNTSVTEEP
ncbi:hypothetical protein RN001_013632 [Aquatica leii]|uniref:Geminin n=1 Tax=Aquatica leii TaxID=1421715 RepID=A0AAN7P0A9_9COLE|nr:hypothetical protein RN001_013632 [Aquatica leii]